MCSYNRVNGVYASQNRWLLTDVLRGEWGFDGVVVSDWGAVHDRVAALAAGLDLEMPPNLGVSDAAIVAAVRDGSLDGERARPGGAAGLRRRPRRPRARPGAEPATSSTPAPHHALARRRRRPSAGAAQERRRHPAAAPEAPGTSVAVIGEFARTPRYQGAGSSRSTRPGSTYALDELTPRSCRRARLRFAAGLRPRRRPADDSRTWPPRPSTLAATGRRHPGLPRPARGRGVRGLRPHPHGPARRTRPRCCHAAGREPTRRTVVVVLANGSAVELSAGTSTPRPSWNAGCPARPAVGATATCSPARPTRPGGWPRPLPLRLQDNPSYLNFPGEAGHVRYGEGVFVGYRGYDAARPRSATRSATACPTRPSATRTSPPRSTARPLTATWASP